MIARRSGTLKLTLPLLPSGPGGVHAPQSPGPGYLKRHRRWCRELLVKDLAEREGIDELSEDHWEIVRYIRDYWTRLGIAPLIRRLCKETGKDIDTIYELFPAGPADGACKIAGLPTPTGCT